MKRFLCPALFIASFTVLASGAQADVANFEAKCTWNAGNTTFTCEFDSTRPTSNPTACGNSLAPQYRWTYGDGSSSPSSAGTYGFSSKPNHTYASPPPGVFGYVAKLKIRCFQSANPESYTYAEIERYICVFGLGSPGCIHVDGNWY